MIPTWTHEQVYSCPIDTKRRAFKQGRLPSPQRFGT